MKPFLLFENQPYLPMHDWITKISLTCEHSILYLLSDVYTVR